MGGGVSGVVDNRNDSSDGKLFRKIFPTSNNNNNNNNSNNCNSDDSKNSSNNKNHSNNNDNMNSSNSNNNISYKNSTNNYNINNNNNNNNNRNGDTNFNSIDSSSSISNNMNNKYSNKIPISSIIHNNNNNYCNNHNNKNNDVIYNKNNITVSTSKHSSNLMTEVEIQDLIKTCTLKNLVELYAVGCSDEEVKEELSALVEPCIVWVKSSQCQRQLQLQIQERISSNIDSSKGNIKVGGNMDRSMSGNMDRSMRGNMDRNMSVNMDRNMSVNMDRNMGGNMDRNMSVNMDRNIGHRYEENNGDSLNKSLVYTTENGRNFNNGNERSGAGSDGCNGISNNYASHDNNIINNNIISNKRLSGNGNGKGEGSGGHNVNKSTTHNIGNDKVGGFGQERGRENSTAGCGVPRVGFQLSESSELSLEEVVGTEETVWCPTLGIKGQIDMVVKAHTLSSCDINSISSSTLPSTSTFSSTQIEYRNKHHSNFNSSVIMPLELKTGKASMQIAHRAQVMLYVLMLVFREHSASNLITEEDLSMNRLQGSPESFDQMTSQEYSHENFHENSVEQSPLHPPTHGLLLYLNREGTKCETVTPKWQEICSLMISRNDLAGHIKHSNSLVRKTHCSSSSILIAS